MSTVIAPVTESAIDEVAIARSSPPPSGRVKVSIPVPDADQFAAYMETAEYHKHERDYKDAVHTVFTRLLSPESLAGPDGPRRLTELLSSPMPDLDALGIPKVEASGVRAALDGIGGLRGAIDNLAGGGRAYRDYAWIPAAMSAGLGDPIMAAFQALMDESTNLANRVDAFREELRNLRQESQRRSGVVSVVPDRPVQLAFTATLLAGYDRARYSFYSFTALAAGYRRYASAELLQGTPPGEKYVEVCAFVRSVLDELRQHDVQAKDMIDAQSFIWLTQPEGRLDPAALHPIPPTPKDPTTASSVAATESEVDDIIAGRRGQGFGLTAAERHAVEHRAMGEVTRFYSGEGWEVVPVFRTASYDLHATRGPEEKHIEVKGTTGAADAVLLTRGEVAWAHDHPSKTVLAVVHKIELNRAASPPVATGGQLRLVGAWPVSPDSDDLEAIAYRYRIRVDLEDE